MSLLNQFPEIVLFFKQHKFSEDSLHDLINTIENKYKDASILKSAKALIDLELLKFKIQGISKIDNSISQNPRKLTNSDKKTHTSVKINLTSINSFPRNIREIGLKLKLNKGYVLKVLRRNNIVLNERKELNEQEMKLIEPFIIKRLEELNRKIKSELRVGRSIASDKMLYKKKYRKGNSKLNSVYDKIRTHGLGKLIYIKSK